MMAIFRGRRYKIGSQCADGIWLELLGQTAQRIHVALSDVDLMVNPTTDHLGLAEAFERGEIGAFEYPDGHTCPPGREIPRRRRPEPPARAD